MAKHRQVRRAIDEAIETALTAVGMHVENQVIELVPVDTGRLKGSITHATTKSKSKVRPPAKADDGIDHDGSKDTVLVGTNVEYAAYVEYGTKYSAAQPYLRRGLELTKGDIPEIFAKTIKARLERL